MTYYNVCLEKNVGTKNPDELMLGCSFSTADEAQEWANKYSNKYGEKFVVTVTDLEYTDPFPWRG